MLLELAFILAVALPSILAQQGIEESSSSPNITVDVYYESLCPDSRHFVLHQLYPTWQKLGSIFSINFVPYGKATTFPRAGSYSFSCQHGPIECQGNVFHACSVKYIQEPNQRMEIVRCMMTDNYDPRGAVLRCASELNLDAAEILECGEGKEGRQLLATAGQLTLALSPKLTFVPTIEINKEQRDQRSVRENFMKELCSVYKGPEVAACSSVA